MARCERCGHHFERKFSVFGQAVEAQFDGVYCKGCQEILGVQSILSETSGPISYDPSTDDLWWLRSPRQRRR